MDLPTNEFDAMREELEEYGENRDELMKESRSLLREAKRAVYLCHEGKLEDAKQLLEQLEKNHARIENEYSAVLDPTTIGPYKDALEEYVEAALLRAFLKKEPLPTRQDLSVPTEEYLAGLADLTGEVTRRAVFAAMQQDADEVRRIWEFVSAVSGELMQFHFRSGKLRNKYDSIKYNLKKIEDTLYDLEMRE